ncbi:MAG TPA: FAD-dependent oxidoreductase [Pyrinomonadaceae bacterium]|nr:FAD-dependent oxidoreductase [Pyrinomonadaceae bacterium]
MGYEVVVVGAGIGGLTVAALLAARGVDVCLLERESQPGGCVATFEKFGYKFDPSLGLFTDWQPGGIHDRVFAELPVSVPEVSLQDAAYVVRLPDQTNVPICASTKQFEETLKAVFPECADRAIEFYQFKDQYQTVSESLEGTSPRFRRFIDVQLQLLTQRLSDECSYKCASDALNVARQGVFSIRGGAPALTEKLAASIKASGGRVRFDTPVLRLAYDTAGQAVGVDLLSGETVHASRAIVSNLTIWDTFGRLVGLNRTPLEIRKRLTTLTSWGVYLLYVGMDEAVASRLPNNRILALTDWQEQDYDPETDQFMFAAAPADDLRAPDGKRAVTILTFSDVENWFTFHENEDQHEQQDQLMIEAWWPRIHQAIPELGESLELIETVTPRIFYDLTRRKLGMVGAVKDPSGASETPIGPNTSVPNVFMVGDTTLAGAGVGAVTKAALSLVNKLTN